MGNKVATREAYGKALVKLSNLNDRVVVLDADLSKSTKTADFKTAAPERFINMGIAEGNMMGVAAGLATCGKIPFASSFAMFAAGRAFEQIRNSICYPRLNVKVCATHAGLTVGEDGATHQSVEDIALMRAVETVNDENNYKFEIGKGITLSEGNDVTIVATGMMVQLAIKAKEELSKEGINAKIINIHTIKPIDCELLVKAAKETGAIVTAEEHSIVGGLGSAVSEVVTEEFPVPVVKVGIKDTFGESGKPDQLLEKYGLTVESIVNSAKRAISLKR